MPDVRLQSNLGDIKRFERKDQNMGGLITVGRVVNVHHKNHTADVMLLKNKDMIIGSEETEGMHSCRIVEMHAGWDEKYQAFYGDVTPIQEGELVIVAFLENYKARPFILGAIHDIDNDKNPLPKDYPLLKIDEKHRYERLHITRTQDYVYVSGEGEFEAVHHSKAFIRASEKELDDNRGGFDFEDLSVKSKQTGRTIQLTENQRDFKPLNFLVSLRDKFSDAAGFLKIWVSSAKGAIRLSKDKNDGTLSFTEITEDGQFRFKRQLDSNIRDQGSNFSEVSVSPDGTVVTQRMVNGKLTQVVMPSGGGIVLNTTELVNIHGDKMVNVTSDSVINITAPVVNISG